MIDDAKAPLPIDMTARENLGLQKERNKESLNKVVEYCYNKHECRRSMVLLYFDELFDPANCDKTCDNCFDKEDRSVVDFDITQHARQILELVSHLQDSRVTVIQARDVYRGSIKRQVRWTVFAQTPSPTYGS